MQTVSHTIANIYSINFILTVCKQSPIDLGVVLDSSSSIHPKDFKKAISFLQDFLERFEVNNGPDGVRVSIITYGKGIYPEDGFNLTTYNSKEEVLDAVGQIPHRAGLYTDTGKAIKYLHEVQFAPDVVRPYAEHVALVVTDGNSQEWRLTKQMAEETREDGIKVFAIGVGSGVREEELLNIAGDESRVTKVNNYNELDLITETLAAQTCIQKEKPTTTELPKTEKCGEKTPTDLYYVFNPVTLGLDATAWTTSFISNTIKSEDLDVGFRYGVISGSCPDDEGFDLDEYDSVDDIRERLQQYDTNRLPQLVERLLNDGYSEEKGGRTEARKVAVIVSSGDSKEVDELSDRVAELIENGVTVFIADPSGEGLTVDGATPLTGRSSRLQSETLIGLLCPTK
uniref:VWFA domain-containing protein n=1 Tax=Arion vulgaris TaxID=1028688 RepID=A0A0B7B7R1_9EUPU